ncbi:MAG: glycosyltransferase family 39 protein [Phenylobacterium sp.]|uniref:Glycosyltransferase family 39 protein n=1 Tax=Phenylobacterium ferrooxidans TaxID=2982689 RepID=A0ABW6CNU5_9CAUL|nr:glycosyltransferase family 39 protein [Phenylobacterium sp.]MDO8321426.1 glycosyltransferase family 39 protein [Phenylobacterium sp.]MDO8911512.1 glycosyltransferase family 39 protein [Phenylobacterium sp.]MDO9244854.1 glycosyltransferase family 39 protein [Phenylobacterium sp.]MDP2010746.1 glycosyltransferase family 39 protein [Phenylobacterium sp.]MDP3100261.1 glycosyltransferase family 39 protein [Phenylobacterium sp.]
MTLDGFIERWSRGWRGPALAALIAFLAGLPGVFAVPPLDRDESRFAQATAQMLETGDFVVIRFQDEPRFKKPVGIYWMQAGSVALLSQSEARDIWAYRIPSLLGAMLAAAACAWGAAVFFGGPTGLLAGGLFASTLLLSSEAFIAKTDAVLAGTTTLALAALGRIYAGSLNGAPAGRLTRLLFWLGLSVAVLVKGPVGLMVVALTAATLWIWDRKAPWLKRLGWSWGLILFAAVIGPWAWAVTVATDGGFWSAAVVGDLAPKLAGGQESHGAPPGYHTLATPLLFFPAALLLPAALVFGWRNRAEPGVRFALAWLVPAFLVFELTPTKLVHYTLPTYGALAWLAAAALRETLGGRVRWAGAGLSALVGLLLAVGVGYLMAEYGDASDLPAALVTGALLAAAGLAGAYLLMRGQAATALVTACGLGILGHTALAAAFAPRLEPLWISQRTEHALAAARLLPRQGIAPAPVAVAGYAEPSLVFALGTPTDLGGPDQAAEALADNRPAVVESREQKAFDAAIKARGLKPRQIGEVSGLDYSNGDETTLRIYAPPPTPPEAAP